jgi:hypothetical protein
MARSLGDWGPGFYWNEGVRPSSIGGPHWRGRRERRFMFVEISPWVDD